MNADQWIFDDLHVRRGLEALISRAVFYELVEMAEDRDTPEGRRLGIESGGVWFVLGPAEATDS